MEKISIIIPTYNRFHFLLNTIEYCKKQTYPNTEIIVINDCSTQKEYYEHDWGDVIIIHLKENSKTTFGHSCPGGYQRNFGIDIASGKYIAFCDDDDIWLPNKLELQIQAMQKHNCKMSSTDGLIGKGVYDPNKNYRKYNSEHYFGVLKNIYKKKGSDALDNDFPDVWDLKFANIHNCFICSSVIIHIDVINQVGHFVISRHADDYQYWKRALQFTNSAYVKDICFYYDAGHGNGKEY